MKIFENFIEGIFGLLIQLRNLSLDGVNNSFLKLLKYGDPHQQRSYYICSKYFSKLIRNPYILDGDHRRFF